jgi:flagellar basal-body rod modification protein FlgD
LTNSSSPIGSNGPSSTQTPGDTMGPNGSSSAADLQQTFLTLLVTQLKNQDPTSPMDSSQMTSQLAQIDTVSGIAQLNQSLNSLSAQLSSSEEAQASSLIGRDVLVPGDGKFTVANPIGSDGNPIKDKVAASPFGIKLPVAATDLQVQIENSDGTVVNTIDLKGQPAGVIPIPSLNAVDQNNKPLPPGNYKFTAQDIGGAAVGSNAPVLLTGLLVLGVVTQADGTPGLTTQFGTVPLNGGVSGFL